MSILNSFKAICNASGACIAGGASRLLIPPGKTAHFSNKTLGIQRVSCYSE